jgi:hypothetical protein
VSTVDAAQNGETVQALGRRLGFEWDIDESQLIAEQLRGIQDALRQAGAHLTAADEPASVFQVVE